MLLRSSIALTGVTAFALLCSCRSDDVDGVASHSGLAFTYAGQEVEGTFQATSGNRLVDDPRGYLYRDNGSITLMAARVDSAASIYDFVTIALTPNAMGSVTIPPACTNHCASEWLFQTGVGQDGVGSGYWCEITSGTMAITSQTATRMTGTFSGTGGCRAAASPTTTMTPFAVTDGTFDVPYMTVDR